MNVRRGCLSAGLVSVCAGVLCICAGGLLCVCLSFVNRRDSLSSSSLSVCGSHNNEATAHQKTSASVLH